MTRCAMRACFLLCCVACSSADPPATSTPTPQTAPTPSTPSTPAAAAPTPSAPALPSSTVQEGWDGYATSLECAPDTVHIRLHALRFEASLHLEEAEEALLDAVDLKRTRKAKATMFYVGIDHLMRRIIPLQLEASDHASWAQRFRALPTIKGARGVAQASELLDALFNSDSDYFLEQNLIHASHHLERMTDDIAQSTDRYAENDCMERGEMPQGEAQIIEAALDSNAPRAVLVSEIVTLLNAMAKAARSGR